MVRGGGTFLAGCPTTVHGGGDENAVLFECALENGPICVEAAGSAEGGVYLAMKFCSCEGDDRGFEIDGDSRICVVEVFYALGVIVVNCRDRGGCILAGWTGGTHGGGVVFFKETEWESRELFFGEMIVSYGSLFGNFAVETRVTHAATDVPGESLLSEFEDRSSTVDAER